MPSPINELIERLGTEIAVMQDLIKFARIFWPTLEYKLDQVLSKQNLLASEMAVLQTQIMDTVAIGVTAVGLIREVRDGLSGSDPAALQALRESLDASEQRLRQHIEAIGPQSGMRLSSQ